MNKNLNAELSVNGICVKIDSYELISKIVDVLPDEDDEFQNLFEILANSSSSKIRFNVACKENINKETVHILLQDKNINVLRALVRSSIGLETIKYGDLSRMIDDVGNHELLVDIAENLSYFSNCDSNWIAEKLISFGDPGIRFGLATNDETPRHILIRLSEDPDSSIREATKEMLEFGEEEDEDEEAIIVIEDN